jgi:hypothetical protein
MNQLWNTGGVMYALSVFEGSDAYSPVGCPRSVDITLLEMCFPAA